MSTIHEGVDSPMEVMDVSVLFPGYDSSNFCLSSLRLGMECGSVWLVGGLLDDRKVIEIAEQAGGELLETLTQARSWLAEAEAYEAVHGELSRLDRSHPYCIKEMPTIERVVRYRRGLRRTPATK